MKRKVVEIPVLRVVVMDDDPYAGDSMSHLLRRDVRVFVAARTKNPTELIRVIKELNSSAETPQRRKRSYKAGKGGVDCILLDMDYHDPMEVELLLTQLRDIAPAAVILCHSQTPNFTHLSTAYNHHATGFMIKGDVGFALASVLVRLWQHRDEGYFWITPRLEALVYDLSTLKRERVCVLPAWKLHPSVDPRHKPVLPCLMYGMNAVSISHEVSLSSNAVREYISNLYEYYEDYYNILDTTDLLHIIDWLNQAPARERFFHLVTLLPLTHNFRLKGS